ncbi:meiosis-specific protein ASY1 isoform X2 [Cryptomeria japonica]|uniref:meiosis-specific protein ASY1 isoform X2 n=1 Tax=Cryptomeria japonica TaxID=3369 RepID=UPI0025AB9CFB|nr:meiosis-specific protein ASY1 isoform X2 [Cryptomeria japonica]
MVAIAAQRVKETEISEQDSLLLTRNLLRIAIFNISYIRGLFPEKYFNDKSVPALEMKIKKLMPMDAESRRLIDWMEKGVYDALEKKYLKTLLFCVCEKEDGPMLEEYAFAFSYGSSCSEEVSMNINRSGNKKQGTTFKSNSVDLTPNQMRSSACKMVRTLVQLMRTLDRMPEERTILMKLFYYDDVTPPDYEPPFFRCCGEGDDNSWSRTPLKMKIGDVNSKHFMIALKVKSVLDPCEDENEEGDEGSMDSRSNEMRDDDASESSMDSHDSEEKSPGKKNAPAIIEIGKSKSASVKDHHMQDSDDCEQEAQNLARVKEWILSRHIETLDLSDVLSNFPDISVVSTEDIIQSLVKEGIVTKQGKDLYRINKVKENDIEIASKDDPYFLDETKNEKPDSAVSEDDSMYIKVLYHALPMDYVTLGKLQSKFDGQVNQSNLRKFIDRMASDGFIEGRVQNRRLGKRVIKSEMTMKKLLDLKKSFEIEQEMQAKGVSEKLINPETPAADKDSSTFARFHTVGSDATRHGQSPAENGSFRSGQTISKAGSFKKPASPASKLDMAKPATSRESTKAGKEFSRPKVDSVTTDFGNVSVKCSQNSLDSNFQGMRTRKSSTVKEPIYHYAKRLKV